MSRFAHPDLCRPAIKDASMNPTSKGGVTEPLDNSGAISVDAAPENNVVDPFEIAIEKTHDKYFSGELELKQPANDRIAPSAIGLSGWAQTGKTTAANYIEQKYGYRRQHIAEPLRAMLRTLLLRFGMTDTQIDAFLTGPLKEEVIPCLGVTSRHAQITLGTEWGRELIGDDLWARLWSYEAEQQGGRAMNDSVRFPNEESAVQGSYGGFTILVTRPGTRPAAFKWGRFGELLYNCFGLMWGVHDSERTDKLNPDYVIVNDGTLEELYAEIDDIMAIEGALQCAVS
jgi:hypothetical protein